DRKAALMRNFDDFRYARMDGVRIIEFPYRADLSMMVILPDAVNGLPAIEKTLSAEKLDQWEKALTSQKVDVTFPRFKADLQMLLAEAFRSLGIRQAFSGHADFSGIAKE